MGLGLDPTALEKILWRNARNVYGLDRVAGMAERLDSTA
jgi:hypothetical protein